VSGQLFENEPSIGREQRRVFKIEKRCSELNIEDGSISESSFLCRSSLWCSCFRQFLSGSRVDGKCQVGIPDVKSPVTHFLAGAGIQTFMKAIQVKQPGGPEAMELVDLPVPQPKANEAVVKLSASGVNFIDVYVREGRYKALPPFVLGQEGAGIVNAVGTGVTSVKNGDRVAWSSILGSYAEYAAVPADRLVPVPDGVTDQQAAAAMLQGMTAHYLLYDTYPLKRGETALVHAAAGGVGLLLVQMAHNIGARVIATVSTDEKAKLAREAGADEIILYTKSDFEAETKRMTGGKGVDVVYDSVGKTTFEKGLNVLRPRGMMALFGGSSGAVPPLDLMVLAQKGSLYVTRPTLGAYIASRDELLARSGAVFGMIASGKLKLRIEHTYPLAEAQQAHRDLEGRKTTGKLLLIP
jgi:NADPH2:quinone reductase